MMKLGIVVPTRNRPNELRRLLQNLSEQSRCPDAVVVVDSSDEQFDCEAVVRDFDGWLTVTYIRHWPPSAAAQRNAGIEAMVREVDLVGLIDDDVILDSEALENGCEAIERVSSDFIGFGMNPVGPGVMNGIGALRKSRPISCLGLYSPNTGGVAASGWHTRLVTVDEDTPVDWLTTCAAIWRANALENLRFDEFFHEYSYLEDLDLSLQARHLGRLLVLAEARYEHHAAPGGRKSRFWFGRVEVRNRYYIVTKHGLSRSRFVAGMLIRMGLTVSDIGRGYWREMGRLLGNIVELPRTRRRSTMVHTRY